MIKRLIGTGLFAGLVLMAALSGCGGTKVQVTPAGNSDPFPGAALTIISPQNGDVFPVGEPVSVVVDVQNYNLGDLTPGSEEKNLATSEKGQHAHVIVDNEPYTAVYTSGEKVSLDVLPEGTHTIRAFLSRSWHESLKNDEAFQVVTFHVGKETAAPFVLGQPLLTYSRPKGTYKGPDAKKILVDFWVNGVQLGEEAYAVRLAIDNKSWDLTEWMPYYVEGLAPGTHTFKLTLLDPAGMPAPAPYNPTERTVEITQ